MANPRDYALLQELAKNTPIELIVSEWLSKTRSGKIYSPFPKSRRNVQHGGSPDRVDHFIAWLIRAVLTGVSMTGIHMIVMPLLISQGVVLPICNGPAQQLFSAIMTAIGTGTLSCAQRQTTYDSIVVALHAIRMGGEVVFQTLAHDKLVQWIHAKRTGCKEPPLQEPPVQSEGRRTHRRKRLRRKTLRNVRSRK